MGANKSAVSAVETFLITERRVASEDVIGLLAARLALSRGDVSRAVTVLIQVKKLLYRRSGGKRRGKIVEIWTPRSRADRLNMSAEGKRQRMYAKGVPSVTHGGEVTSRHAGFSPYGDDALTVLNTCLKALRDKVEASSGRVKNPEKLIATATRQREFRFGEAHYILAVLQELGVVEHLRSSHLGSSGIYVLDLSIEHITESAYQAWLKGESLSDEPDGEPCAEVESDLVPGLDPTCGAEPEASPHIAAVLGDVAQMCEMLQSRLDALRVEMEACPDGGKILPRAIGYVAGAQHRLEAVQDSLEAASEVLG